MQTVSMGYPQLPKASQSSDGGLASSLEGPEPSRESMPCGGGHELLYEYNYPES